MRKKADAARLGERDGTAECSECGQTFEATSRAYRYCSDPCRKNAYYERDYSVPRPVGARKRMAKCRVCGGAFETGGHGQPMVYCSDACKAAGKRTLSRQAMRRHLADPAKRAVYLERRSASRRRRRAEAARSRIEQCRECGTKFTPANPNHRYCSDACRVASRARRYAASYRRRRMTIKRGPPRTKKCPVCSAEFAPGLVEGRLRNYCSRACRADARRAAGREYARRKRRPASAAASAADGAAAAVLSNFRD